MKHPLTLTTIHQIMCNAQYKAPDCTRVTTRINMMRRLGRIRGSKPFLLTRAQEVTLARTLGIDLGWTMHGDLDGSSARLVWSYRPKAKPSVRDLRRAKRRRRAARARELHARWVQQASGRTSVF